MRSRSAPQFITLAALLCTAALMILPIKSRPGDGVPSAPPFLDLLPNITRGLDLSAPAEIADTPQEPKDSAHASIVFTDDRSIAVWNGSEEVTMSFTDYLIGVTAAEMPAGYEEEALKAQAVAARTFAAKHLLGEARCRSGHTICTDPSCCQAFITVEKMRANWGASFDKYYSKIREAVLSTEGQVLTSGGELVTALYHSSSGGRTENCEAVFAVALPYLVSVESEGEEDSPEYRTVKTYTAAEFTAAVNSAFPEAQMTDPAADLVVWQRTDSGRIALIRLGGTVVTGQQLRNALGLRSTNAEFDITADTVTVTCLGFGHGVGMSQCGANAMAKQGAGYEEILKHYYTGVEIASPEPETAIWAVEG